MQNLPRSRGLVAQFTVANDALVTDHGAMGTLKFSIPQVRPLKLTLPRFDPDEIYLAYVVQLGRSDKAEHTWAAGRLSTIHNTGGKKPYKMWTPTSIGKEDGADGMSLELDTGDADLVMIHVRMFEADNRQLWEEFKTKAELKEICKPENFDWRTSVKHLQEIKTVCLEAPNDLEKAACTAVRVFRAALPFVDFLRQDDYVGGWDYVVPLGPNPYSMRDRGINTRKFANRGGEYEVTTNVVVE